MLSEGICSIPPGKAKLQKASSPSAEPERHGEAGQSSALILSALKIKPKAVPAACRWGFREMAGQGAGRGCAQPNAGGSRDLAPCSPADSGVTSSAGTGTFCPSL